MDNSRVATAVLAPSLPSLEEIARSHPGWLDSAITEAEAAEIVGLAAPTLATKRSRGGDAPAHVKIGASVRYTRRTCYEFLARRMRRTTVDITRGAIDPEPSE